jgi:hypothetical protein
MQTPTIVYDHVTHQVVVVAAGNEKRLAEVLTSPGSATSGRPSK